MHVNVHYSGQYCSLCSECVALTTYRLPWPQVVNLLVIDWLPKNYGDVNKPLPGALSSGISWFTVIIPCPPVYNYNVCPS